MKKRVGLKTYKVRVETGKKNKCGTEARVFITLFGSKGKSTKTRIFKFSGNGAQNPDHVSFKAGFQNNIRAPVMLVTKVVVNVLKLPAILCQQHHSIL